MSEIIISQDHRIPGLVIDTATISTEHAPEYLLVLMPSAIAGEKINTYHEQPTFSRMTWAPEFPEGDVIVATDPILRHARGLRGGWYIYPEADIISALASLVKDHAEMRDIPSARILYYGSSLGGFGAIAAAAHTPGARAIAEVPQIDVENWLPKAVTEIEDMVIGVSLSEYRENFPEQINLIDRLEFAGHVPLVKIVTNQGDRSYRDQQLFAESVNSHSSRVELIDIESLKGHVVLPKSKAIELIRTELSESMGATLLT